MSSVVSEIGRKYLRMHLASGVGPVRLGKLIEHFGTIDAVLAASMGELQRVSGVGPKVAEAVFAARSDEKGDEVEREIKRAEECGAKIFCMADEDYPKALLNIPDPPTCLYVRESLAQADAVAIAIVGTRKCSHYAREQALRFGELLAGAGFTIVSGFARGVDGYAHEGALRAGGRTIGVLGNGLSEIYPTEHAELAGRIVESGALVSELPMDIAPDSKNFPGRNRIIAGMSLGVLVVEAGKGSGALITAEAATEYNREVFAIPGAVDRAELTAGSNGLIQRGEAKLVTCLEDILDELKDVGRLMARGAPSEDERGVVREDGRELLLRGLTKEQRAVYDVIKGDPVDVDGVCLVSGADAAGAISALTSLQIRGLIKQLPGGRFARRA